MIRALVGLLLLAGLQACGVGRAAALEADLSKHLVAITTGFAGSDVLLYGAVDGPGDVIVVVRGPNEPLVMHRKSRIVGVWANTATMTFEDAPSFYAVASSRPLEEIASPATLNLQKIGVNHLNLDLGLRASPNLEKSPFNSIRLMSIAAFFSSSDQSSNMFSSSALAFLCNASNSIDSWSSSRPRPSTRPR